MGSRAGEGGAGWRRVTAMAVSGAVAVTLVAPSGGGAAGQVPAGDQTPPSLQLDRPLAPPAAAGSPQAEEAVRRHRDLGVRIAGLLAETERLGRQSSTLLGELRKLDVERELQEARAEQARAALALIESDLAELDDRIAVLSAARDRATPAVTARLQRLQRLGRIGYARIAWGSSSAQTLGRAARMMTHMAREDSERLVQFQELTEQLRTAEARLQARRAEAVELRTTSGQLLLAANAAVAERRRLLARVASERDAHVRVIDELERARKALDGAVASYRPPEATPSAGAMRPAPPTPLTTLRRKLPWPLTGHVEQAFGRRRDSRFGTTVIRNGIDIAAPAGADVKAVHGGTVAFADEFAGFGRVVIVDHGQQAFTLYGYLSAVLVAPGAAVTSGTIVGQVGEAPTGGPSLYFELRIDGRPVDPLQWLTGR